MKTDNSTRNSAASNVSRPSNNVSTTRTDRSATVASPEVSRPADSFARTAQNTNIAAAEAPRPGLQREVAGVEGTATAGATARTRNAAMPEATTGAVAPDTAGAPDTTGATNFAPAMTQSVEGGNNIRRGAEGPAVRELQEALNRNGAGLQADGDFGPRTQAAVRDFQRQNGLQADGIVGPRTLEALQRSNGAAPTQPNAPADPAAPTNPTAPTGPADATGFVTGDGRVSSGWGANSAQRTQQAEALLRANGQWPPQEGRAYAIQIDQDAPPGSASQQDRNSYARSYSGETAVFRAENGHLVEVSGDPMRSASHPGQFRSTASPDVNGDGRGDVAHIRTGVYDYSTRLGGKGGNRYNPIDDGQFRNSARDVNGNGVIDGSEVDRNYSASAIQIHMGNSNSPSSIGCQTMPPNDYSRFQQAIRSANTGGQGSFTYILARRPNDQFGANPY
ncbi:MAG: peptidoglycan-binding protein [Myxococcales bacterium]|nr:peptidoglycan-binding protein [Myxococcales bacterium]